MLIIKKEKKKKVGSEIFRSRPVGGLAGVVVILMRGKTEIDFGCTNEQNFIRRGGGGGGVKVI